MYPAGNLFIPASHGRLEAILREPQDIAVRGVALLLHPHPLGGGTMHNKVVFRAGAALNDAGLIVLRINFRGVGQSTGTHDDGRGELEDVKTGLEYLSKHYSDLPITVAGFSFGARVGLEVGMTDKRVVRLISIGTPVEKYDFGFLKACNKPILFVHGDQDEFGSTAKLQDLVSQLRPESHARLNVIPGAGHFFEGHLDELKRIITEWVSDELQKTNES
jgi:uncharacterized protein